MMRAVKRYTPWTTTLRREAYGTVFGSRKAQGLRRRLDFVQCIFAGLVACRV